MRFKQHICVLRNKIYLKRILLTDQPDILINKKAETYMSQL